MKTLVIHPDDPTTTFLKEIYKNKDVTLINDPATPIGKIADEINKHDRIIMCGHGCPDGLFGMNPSGFMVSAVMMNLFKGKNLIGIWCNADKFFNSYNLTGFFTGMFISEVGEARCYDINASQEEVTASNYAFSEIVGKYNSAEEMFWAVRNQYLKRCDNSVSQFNNERMYFAAIENDLRVLYAPIMNIEDKMFEKDITEYLTDSYEDSNTCAYEWDRICMDTFYDDEDIAGDFDPEWPEEK